MRLGIGFANSDMICIDRNWNHADNTRVRTSRIDYDNTGCWLRFVKDLDSDAHLQAVVSEPEVEFA